MMPMSITVRFSSEVSFFMRWVTHNEKHYESLGGKIVHLNDCNLHIWITFCLMYSCIIFSHMFSYVYIKVPGDLAQCKITDVNQTLIRCIGQRLYDNL